jgi:Tol biopolymer transport system component
MGQVWRAKDSQLGRDVALKVLPEGFTQDPERLARFEREAKLLAQLNHPNIAQIYGMEASGETRALVMELVEGPTLADRLESGSLPFNESLSFALQIAQALEEAHDKGIVHRDLKPQNIKASLEGKVKVLDFGLAKAMDPLGAASGAGSASQLAHSPTLTLGATVQGVILGTAAYMAPEQAKGMATDKRADIWAFGVVLFEMLAGGRLFAGDSVTDTLADVLRREVDFGALPPETPRAIRELVRRCLERNPKNRLHDIADARLVLEEVLGGRSESAPAAASSGPTPVRARGVRPRELVAWSLAAIATAVAVAAALGRMGSPEPAPVARQLRFSVPLETGATPQGIPAIAPDGRTVVYVAQPADGEPGLYAHSLESGSGRWLAGTEGAEQPFFGADPNRLGYFAAGRVKQLDLATGLLRDLRGAPDPRGGAWTQEGDLLVSPNSASPVERVSPGGGPARFATELTTDRGEQSHRYPWVLPGGALLYTSQGSTAMQGIYWRGPAGGEARRIAPDLSRAVYDRGRLLWTRQAVLLAQPFDPATGELSGEPLPIGERVGRDSQKGAEYWFAAGGGTVAILRGGGTRTALVWRDRRGEKLDTLAQADNFFEPSLSSDGRRVAVSIELGERRGIWIYDAATPESARRLTYADDGSETVSWSPDGRWIAYTEPREQGGWTLVRRAADGTGEEEVLFVSGAGSWIDSWSPDGSTLLFERHLQGENADLWQLRIGESEPKRLVQGPATEAHGAFSPDGRHVAYVSDETGTPQVFVRALGDSGSRWQVSQSGGDWPVWRPDGKELFYAGSDLRLRAVPVLGTEPFQFGAEATLFRLSARRPGITSARTAFAASRDGQRFLVNESIEDASDARLEIVTVP